MADHRDLYPISYGPDWHVNRVQRYERMHRRRGFTFRRNPKTFVTLTTIFVLFAASLIAKVEFGWSFF